jgi:hypothetical protein
MAAKGTLGARWRGAGQCLTMRNAFRRSHLKSPRDPFPSLLGKVHKPSRPDGCGPLFRCWQPCTNVAANLGPRSPAFHTPSVAFGDTPGSSPRGRLLLAVQEAGDSPATATRRRNGLYEFGRDHRASAALTTRVGSGGRGKPLSLEFPAPERATPHPNSSPPKWSPAVRRLRPPYMRRRQ